MHQTHRILHAVDPQILDSFSLNLEGQLRIGDEKTALRVLEVAPILGPDGESYAQRVGAILARIELASKGKDRASAPNSPAPSSPALSASRRSATKRAPVVYEQMVEVILGHLKDRGAEFAAIFTTTVLHGALLS